MLREHIPCAHLDLATEVVKIHKPLMVAAQVTRITNAVTVDLEVGAALIMTCSRCLTEFENGITRSFRLNYQVEKQDQVIDLDPDIREEILLEYPINPLCNPGCKGLCLVCGKNLNDGPCSCKMKKR
ncbi:MAG: DUF177 domain-containing protein [Candidatus Omnitrophica bacterium]|nr:DUF177 domain-containing protein [Candidatus Omnitrophota bacterium]